ncbi:hypothetical protein HanIR_Chr14g0685421 [Helianthus annuus]|nr:hypothetical protein HanIR_Chr14g0685421 [Helianthus annuus]
MLIWRGVKKFGLKSMDLEGLFWYRKMSHFKDAFDIWRKKGCEQKNEFNIDGQEMIFYTGIMEFIVFLYLWQHDRVFIQFIRFDLSDINKHLPSPHFDPLKKYQIRTSMKLRGF